MTTTADPDRAALEAARKTHAGAKVLTRLNVTYAVRKAEQDEAGIGAEEGWAEQGKQRDTGRQAQELPPTLAWIVQRSGH